MSRTHQPTRRPFWLPLQAPNDIKGAILCFPAEAYVLTGNGKGAGNHTHTHTHVCGSMYKWDCMHVCSQAGSRVSADTLTPVPQYLHPSLCSIGITTLKLDLCFAMSSTPDSHTSCGTDASTSSAPSCSIRSLYLVHYLVTSRIKSPTLKAEGHVTPNPASKCMQQPATGDGCTGCLGSVDAQRKLLCERSDGQNLLACWRGCVASD